MEENSFISNFKFIFGIFIFIIFVFIIFFYMGGFYKDAADENVINAFTKKRFDDFYALEKNSLDMVFVGSSHAYCTFDPNNFDDALGINSFQMGTPLQHADTTYMEMIEIFNYQSPSVVVMEVYWDVLDDDFEMKQADSFFEVLQNEDLKKKYIKEVFPLGEKVKYSLSAIRFQQDFFAYKANEMKKGIEEKYSINKEKVQEQTGTEYYLSKGYVYCDMVMKESEFNETNQFVGLDGENFVMSRKQEHYLKEIVKLAKNKGSKLVFVTAPVANVSIDYIKNYENIHETISNFAKENNIEYIDYNMINKEKKFLENENFRDDAHLNDSGVKIVNKHFLEYLKEKF